MPDQKSKIHHSANKYSFDRITSDSSSRMLQGARCNTDHPKPYLRPVEAAAYIGLSPITLAKMRMEAGSGPPFYRASARAIVYSVEDLDTWLTSRKCISTSDDGGRS